MGHVTLARTVILEYSNIAYLCRKFDSSFRDMIRPLKLKMDQYVTLTLPVLESFVIARLPLDMVVHTCAQNLKTIFTSVPEIWWKRINCGD